GGRRILEKNAYVRLRPARARPGDNRRPQGYAHGAGRVDVRHHHLPPDHRAVPLALVDDLAVVIVYPAANQQGLQVGIPLADFADDLAQVELRGRCRRNLVDLAGDGDQVGNCSRHLPSPPSAVAFTPRPVGLGTRHAHLAHPARLAHLHLILAAVFLPEPSVSWTLDVHAETALFPGHGPSTKRPPAPGCSRPSAGALSR